MKFADALAQAQEKAGLSNVQVAAALGVSEQAVYSWRRGQAQPKGAHLIKLMQLMPQLSKLVEAVA